MRDLSGKLCVRSLAVVCGALILNILGSLSIVTGAQTNTATLSGTVTDNSGAVMSDVAITVSNAATGLTRRVTTNREGFFTVPLLPPGIYSLRAERNGFSPLDVSAIDLPVAGQVALDISMRVGRIGDTVNISAAPPLLQSDTSALAEVVKNRQVDLLRINGRDYRSMRCWTP